MANRSAAQISPSRGFSAVRCADMSQQLSPIVDELEEINLADVIGLTRYLQDLMCLRKNILPE